MHASERQTKCKRHSHHCFEVDFATFNRTRSHAAPVRVTWTDEICLPVRSRPLARRQPLAIIDVDHPPSWSRIEQRRKDRRHPARPDCRHHCSEGADPFFNPADSVESSAIVLMRSRYAARSANGIGYAEMNLHMRFPKALLGVEKQN